MDPATGWVGLDLGRLLDLAMYAMGGALTTVVVSYALLIRRTYQRGRLRTDREH